MGQTTDGDVQGMELGVPVLNDIRAEPPLTPEEIDRFREQLQHLRDWALQNMGQFEGQREGSTAASVEGAEAAWQESIRQRALADKRLLLHEVTQAFERIAENTYGRCVIDDAPIPRAVLEELPWARFCGSCANDHSHAPRPI